MINLGVVTNLTVRTPYYTNLHYIDTILALYYLKSMEFKYKFQVKIGKRKFTKNFDVIFKHKTERRSHSLKKN